MSKANTAEALGGTRQLLDELDALMDQMLALPIAEQDTAGAPSSPPDQTPTTISATLTMLDSAPAALADSAEIAIPFSAPASLADVEVAPIPVLSDVAAPKMVKPMALPNRPPTTRWRADDIAFQFLRWVNQGYDHSTTWLGKPGDRLRGRWARTLLGLGGLALLGLALGWLCKDWMGWNW